MNEMPLVLFTILSQIAIGGFITLWILDLRGISPSLKTGFLLNGIFAGISMAAVLASLFHLGHPFEAYRALANFRESWLSREVTFFALFILFVLLYTFAWWWERRILRRWSGILSAFFGVATLISSAMIYTIPAVPAWNNAFPTLSFFLTAFMLGPFTAGVFLTWRREPRVSFSSLVLRGMTLTFLLFVLYVTALLAGLPEANLAAHLMLNDPIFWIRGLTFILAYLLLIRANVMKRGSLVAMGLPFTLLLISEVMGRILFYETAIHL